MTPADQEQRSRRAPVRAGGDLKDVSLRPHPQEEQSARLWSDGYWHGPRSLRIFVARNRAAIALGVVAWTALLSIGFWNSPRPWLTVAHVAVLACAITVGTAFCLSRGWTGNTNE